MQMSLLPQICKQNTKSGVLEPAMVARICVVFDRAPCHLATLHLAGTVALPAHRPYMALPEELAWEINRQSRPQLSFKPPQ